MTSPIPEVDGGLRAIPSGRALAVPAEPLRVSSLRASIAIAANDQCEGDYVWNLLQQRNQERGK